MVTILLDLLKRLRFVHIISIIAIAFAFGYLCFFTFRLSPAQQQNASEIKISMITTISLVLGYWVGSSASSAKKDAAISTALNAPQPQIKADNIENVNQNGGGDVEGEKPL